MADIKIIELQKDGQKVLVEAGSETDAAFRDAGYASAESAAVKSPGPDTEAAKRLAAGKKGAAPVEDAEKA